jgi:hypothetical protein
MDYDNPQFVAAVKKVLWQAIHKVVSVDNEQDADRQEANTDEQQANGAMARGNVSNEGHASDKRTKGESETYRFFKKFKKNFWKDLKRPKTYVEFLALIFLILYTRETRRTNNLTETALTQSKRQFSDSQASAKSQFDQAQTASLKQFIIDQRPYVWTTDPDLTKHPEGGEPGPRFKIGSKVWWQIYYQNYGKTPAIGVSQRHQLEFGPNALQKLRRSKVSPAHTNGDHSGSILAPGQIMFMTPTSEREATAKDYQFIVLDNTTAHPRYRENSMAVLVHFEYFDAYWNSYDSYVCEVVQLTCPPEISPSKM